MKFKMFFRAYTLPLVILLIGVGLYYIIVVYGIKKTPNFASSSTLNTPITQDPLSQINITQNNPTPNQLESQDKESQDNPQVDSANANTNATSTNTTSSTTAPESPITLTQAELTTQTQNLPVEILDQEPANPQDLNQNLNPEQNLNQNPAQNLNNYFVNVYNANVRQAPSTSSQVIDKVFFGQEIAVREIKDNWAQLASGGFVSHALLSADKPIIIAFSPSSTLNIREQPSTSAKIIGSLRPNQEVRITQIQSNGWVQLESGGFVLYQLLKEKQ